MKSLHIAMGYSPSRSPPTWGSPSDFALHALWSPGHRDSFPLSVFPRVSSLAQRRALPFDPSPLGALLLFPIIPDAIALRSARYVPSSVGLAEPVPARIRLRHRGRDRDRESVGRPTRLRPSGYAEWTKRFDRGRGQRSKPDGGDSEGSV